MIDHDLLEVVEILRVGAKSLQAVAPRNLEILF